ncbi:MAG: aminomethyl-transferring glycine dehydrogenase subunit GcvPA [Nitrospinota bacterium]|nr:aminomethyl-transferring glycine dehydrogenase subunit GcvPA [Nitrospinota bacterium]
MRYIPLSASDREKALAVIGASSVEQLFEDIPAEARLPHPLDIPGPLPEMDLMDWFEEAADKNTHAGPRRTFIGAGAYVHHVPTAVDHLISRTEFFTCYTPYQPEVSQGTLAAIYEYQTYTAALLGMEVANASMYDGPSALAEAVIMACRVTGRSKVVMPNLVHPHWRQVVQTYTQHLDIELVHLELAADGVCIPEKLAAAMSQETAAVVVQSPNFFGYVEDMDSINQAREESGALLIGAVAEPMSLGLLKGPGASGADIAVAEGRSFGGSLSFGGPALGMFAVKTSLARKMPGRLVGKTKDTMGRDAYTLTLSTREQHIRREKATSNICSNQALMATAAAIHISLLGASGLREVAVANLTAANYLAGRLARIAGVKLAHDKPFFNEFTVTLPGDIGPVLAKLASAGYLAGVDLGRWYPDMKKTILISATEVHSKKNMDDLVDLIAREAV